MRSRPSSAATGGAADVRGRPDDTTAAPFDALWADLLDLGRHAATGGYRRYAWTREDLALREWFAAQATDRGLGLHVDAVGNQWAWWGDPDAALVSGRPGVVTGSHLDSVPDGGAYDGPLGVVSAFAAVDLLRGEGHVPDRPIGVVNFLDEEGTRFGVACAGSRLVTGSLDPDRARALADRDGVTLAEAMNRAGRDPSRLGPDPATVARIGTFVELHVEQGRALTDLGRPVGLGTAIVPHGRWRLDLVGEANHAGTTLLADRVDPMLDLAAAISAARSAAARAGCLATIGKIHVEPNGVNAIPSRVRAWLDARGPSERGVREVVAAVSAAARTDAREESFTPETRFSPTLTHRLAALLDDAPMLATGAGHDAGVLAMAGIPSGMLFVRNPTGVSHSPAEHAEADDCHAGVAALARCLAALTGRGTSAGRTASGPIDPAGTDAPGR